MPDLTGVHHINFTVLDLKKSAAWYSEVLGLTKLWELEDTGQGAKVLFLHPGSRLMIGLTEHALNPGDRFSEFRTGLDHASFSVSTRQELEAWKARFEKLGVEHSPITQTPRGAWELVFRDPDHIQLELFVFTPPAT